MGQYDVTDQYDVIDDAGVIERPDAFNEQSQPYVVGKRL